MATLLKIIILENVPKRLNHVKQILELVRMYKDYVKFLVARSSVSSESKTELWSFRYVRHLNLLEVKIDYKHFLASGKAL